MSDPARRICRSEELADSGEGVIFEVVHEGRAEPAFAIRFAGRVHAYLNRCAHARAPLDWTPGRFFDCEGLHLVCSLHGAQYAPDSGRCAGGPCSGGSLVPLRVEERDGGVYLEYASIAAPRDGADASQHRGR